MSSWLRLCLGLCLCAWASVFSDLQVPPKAEDVHWVSRDFKTILRWSAPPSEYTYTVQFSEDDSDWNTITECLQIEDTECDLTHELLDKDSSFTADVLTEAEEDFDSEELPHTMSATFNPYRESELSAVSFSIHKVAERSVTLNISDPLSGIHWVDKQLTIRDILKKDLKYKVSYYKAGSTGKRDQVVDSNMPQIQNLDPGQSYCFMVAAFVPSRAKSVQQGEWSTQTCTPGYGILDELDMRTVFQAIFIPLVLLIITITVLVIYCRFCRKHKNPKPQENQQRAQCTVV